MHLSCSGSTLLCTALVMWPKPVQYHPQWGSDSDGEGVHQQAQSSSLVGSKRPGELLMEAGSSDLAAPQQWALAKRPKSPYEQGKMADRTPEYYGRQDSPCQAQFQRHNDHHQCVCWECQQPCDKKSSYVPRVCSFTASVGRGSRSAETSSPRCPIALCVTHAHNSHP